MADDPIRFADTVDWLDKARLDLRGIFADVEEARALAQTIMAAVLSQLPPHFQP